MKYDAFISYSHTADAPLAIAVQTELHRFAKPWYRLRALRLYRDQTNTPAVGSLWDEIEKALRDSRYLILIASPAAAQRPWVADEVHWWIRNRSTESLLVVLAAGRLRWSRVTGDFDWDETDALPRSAVGGFRNEPKHVDVSWAKSPTEIDIRDPRFYEVILDLAATLHGKDKDAMGGDDIRQHRKTQTLARSAVALLAALTIGATVAAYVAVEQRREALVQRDTAVRQTAIAVSRQLAAQSEALRRSNARLGLLIAAEALTTFKTIEAKAAMFAAVREEPRLLRFVDAADERVLGLASADTGETVFVPGRPGQLDLVDAITGRKRPQIQTGSDAEIWEVAYDRRRQRLATGDVNGRVVVWTLHPVQKIEVEFALDSPITALQFDGERSRIAAGDDQGGLAIVDLAASDKTVLRIQAHNGRLTKIAFRERTPMVVTVGQDGFLRTWRHGEGVAPVKASKAHKDEIRDLALFDHGATAVTVSSDHTIGRTNLDEAEPATTRVAFSSGGGTLGFALNPVYPLVAIARGDGTVDLLSTTTGRADAPPLLGTAGFPTVVSWSPDGRIVSVGSSGGTLSFWETTRPSALMWSPGGQKGFITGVSTSSDGSKLASVATDRSIAMRDGQSGKLLREATMLAAEPASSVAFDPSGSRIATGTMRGSLFLVDAGSGVMQLEPIAAHSAPISAIGWSADGSMLASGSEKGRIAIHDAATGTPIGNVIEIPDVGTVRQLKFAAMNSRLMAVGGSGIRTWDLKRSQVVEDSFSTPPLNAMAYFLSDDGQWVVLGHFDHSISLRQTVKADQVVRSFQGHSGWLSAVAFSPDNSVLATAALDKSIYLWDWQTGARLAGPLRAHSGLITGIKFSAQGRRMVSSGEKGELIVWNLDPDFWLAEGCAIANRQLSRLEWSRYRPDWEYAPKCTSPRGN